LPERLGAGLGQGGRMTSRSVVRGCLSAYRSVVNRPVSDRRWTTLLVLILTGSVCRLTAPSIV